MPKVAASPEDLLSPAELLAMSGLDYLRAMQRGEFAGAPISAPMNFALSEVEHGCVTFTGTPEFRHANPMGGVHGGWFGTLLDSCMACAVMSTLKAGSYYTTLEYKINITRALPLGTEVRATGRIQHAGRTTGVASGEVRDAAGTLYATGSTTCLIMQR